MGLAVEARLFARGREARPREAVAWSVGWLVLSLAVAAGIALASGPAGSWTTVYLIERSLSLDNVFLFSLLIGYFAVPPELREKVVVFGVAGALVLRAIAIVAGLAVVHAVEPVIYVFGALLLWVAYRTFRGQDEEFDPESNPVFRRASRVLRASDDRNPLLLPVIAIVLADIAFAVDSIPAALSVTRDASVIWTANAFALLGLGALLALIEVLVQRFRYLDKTIGVILAFVGLKILTANVVPIGDLASLAIIVGLLASGIAISMIADRRDPPHPTELADRRPPRCPPALADRDGRRAA
jgi:tellurite resistance protein TerC